VADAAAARRQSNVPLFLVGICLPDEVNFLKRCRCQSRPLVVGEGRSLPLYVQAHQAKVTTKGETLEISIEDKPAATHV